MKKKVLFVLNFLVSFAELMAGIVLKYQKQLTSERQLVKAEQDISDRKKYEARLKRANRQIEMEKNFSDALIHSLPCVFYLFDESMAFKRWNKNFEHVTGYSSDEIARLNPLDLFHGDDHHRVAGRIMETFEKGTSSVETDLLTKKGEKIPYYLTGMKFQSNDETFLVGVGIDISSQKQVLQSMEMDRKRILSILYQPSDIW